MLPLVDNLAFRFVRNKSYWKPPKPSKFNLSLFIRLATELKSMPMAPKPKNWWNCFVGFRKELQMCFPKLAMC